MIQNIFWLSFRTKICTGYRYLSQWCKYMLNRVLHFVFIITPRAEWVTSPSELQQISAFFLYYVQLSTHSDYEEHWRKPLNSEYIASWANIPKVSRLWRHGYNKVKLWRPCDNMMTSHTIRCHFNRQFRISYYIYLCIPCDCHMCSTGITI